MLSIPPAANDDPDFQDDPSIRDEEMLLRGLIQRYHLPDGPGAYVSPTAFKSRSPEGIRRHLSVFRREFCEPSEVFSILQKSTHLAQVAAGVAREQKPEVVGVAPAGGHRAHARIIRSRRATEADWARVAQKLAEACEVVCARA